MKIAYSFGLADLLHVGHIEAFKSAKSKSDKHYFGLLDDQTAVDWYGQVLSSFEERKATINSIKYIDEVISQTSLNPKENLLFLKSEYPDAEITVYHGENWEFVLDDDFLKSQNIKSVVLPYYEKLSLENILASLTATRKTPGVKNAIVSTKASTLLALKDRVSKCLVEDIFVITENEFLKDKVGNCKRIKEYYQSDLVVVRSSSSKEDGYQKSNAGFYESILNVKSGSSDELTDAILTVAKSYKKSNPDDPSTSDEQILIQRQTSDIVLSGVCFTRDVKDNRPYYLINYDDNGSSDSVTSGAGGKSLWIARNTPSDKVDNRFRRLFDAIKEVESILKGMVLDIEFAVKADGTVVLFQVRPLAANYKFKKNVDDEKFYKLLETVKEPIEHVKNHMLSDMAFWNPAEIIGSNPKKLAYSLYKDIITRRAWNEGLVPMGYNTVNHNLMYQVGNKPYISVDYSFLSLIPSSINESLKNKLLNYYREKLSKNITSHDKIEFEIVYSCFDFATEESLNDLLNHGFSEDDILEFKTALFNITNDAVIKFKEVLAEDTNSSFNLGSNTFSIEHELKNNLTNKQLLDYLFILLGDLKRLGTPQFARQARYAFIAKSFCRSLVSKKIFTADEIDRFMLSVRTIAKIFKDDVNRLVDGEITKGQFDAEYGHLRSGTYDITTPRYDTIDFTNSQKSSSQSVIPFELDRNKLSNVLKESGFSFSYDDFIEFVKTSFEKREWFKFRFTRSLSLALEIIARVGNKLGFTREDMSYLDIADIKSSAFYGSDIEVRTFFRTMIEKRREVFNEYSKLVLPDVILKMDDINMVHVALMRPNFITKNKVNAELVFLEDNLDANIENKIVCVTRADPGFDWIFSRNIKGLITEYGGVASHMAIRCAEFDLPAAIGCGGQIYKQLASFNKVILDCKNEKIINDEF